MQKKIRNEVLASDFDKDGVYEQLLILALEHDICDIPSFLEKRLWQPQIHKFYDYLLENRQYIGSDKLKINKIFEYCENQIHSLNRIKNEC